MKKILIFMGRYLPGYKDGGPIRTISNLVEALGDEYKFYIVCLDRDHGDEKPYCNICYDKWNLVGKANVLYIKPKNFSFKLIKNICESFINNFDNINTKNLLFTGNTGLGKTFLSSCIANELLKKEKTVLYQTSSVMLDTIISYRFGKPNVSKDVYDYLQNVDLLIIDDLGTEGINNMKLVELFNILNSRLLNPNKKTIISTNLSLQNLFSTYDERIVSRLVGNYDICYFFGDDIRFILKK